MATRWSQWDPIQWLCVFCGLVCFIFCFKQHKVHTAHTQMEIRICKLLLSQWILIIIHILFQCLMLIRITWQHKWIAFFYEIYSIACSAYMNSAKEKNITIKYEIKHQILKWKWITSCKAIYICWNHIQILIQISWKQKWIKQLADKWHLIFVPCVQCSGVPSR